MIPVPKVSVVIPTRNRPLTLRNAVNSVLAQTLTDFEVIVVVDGDDDVETSALIASFRDRRLRCIPLAKSVGGSEARNIGVRHARSSFVALLDDDEEQLTHMGKSLAADDFQLVSFISPDSRSYPLATLLSSSVHECLPHFLLFMPHTPLKI